MSINRFFRKYSRVLLMVFMSLLLVVFLVGDVIQSYTQQAGQADQQIGTAFGQPITLHDLRSSQNKLTIAARLGFPVGMFDPLDAMLLMREAELMNVRVSREEVKKTLVRGGVSEERLASLRDAMRIGFDDIYTAVADWMAVLRVANIQSSAAFISEPRLEARFKQDKQQADFSLAVIGSKAFLDRVPEPSDEQIADFFEEHKALEQGHTEDELVFGYRLPDRVQVEYLTVDPKRIQSQVRIREVEARRFFEEHANRYTKQVPKALEGPMAEPEGPEMETVQMTYDEARDRVREDYRAAKAIREAQGLVNEIQEDLSRPWVAMDRDDQGFRNQPPESSIVDWATYADNHAGAYKPAYHKTGIVDQGDLRAEFRLREPRYTVGTTTINLSELAFRVKGLYEPADVEAENLPLLNVLEPSPVLMRNDRNPGTGRNEPYQAYTFRVINVVPSGPPQTMDDDLRDQVIEDWKLARAHELAEEYAQRLYERAELVGLATAVEESPELKSILEEAQNETSGEGMPSGPQYLHDLGPNKPTTAYTRKSRFTQWVGMTEKVPTKVFELAEQTPAEGIEPQPPVALVEVASAFKWVVLEFEGLKPLYRGDLEDQRQQLMQQVSADEGNVIAAWLDPENIRARADYEPMNTPEEADGEPEEGDGAGDAQPA